MEEKKEMTKEDVVRMLSLVEPTELQDVKTHIDLLIKKIIAGGIENSFSFSSYFVLSIPTSSGRDIKIDRDYKEDTYAIYFQVIPNFSILSKPRDTESNYEEVDVTEDITKERAVILFKQMNDYYDAVIEVKNKMLGDLD